MRKLREKRGWSNRTQLSIGRGREVSFFILFRGLFLLFFLLEFWMFLYGLSCVENLDTWHCLAGEKVGTV